MTGKRRLQVALAVLIVGVLAVAVGIALAVTTKSGGGTITAVKVTRQTSSATTTSTTFVNLPSASATMSVPSGHQALILARFSGESECDGGSFGNWCSVQILVNGVQANPQSGSDFAFDSDAGVASGYPVWQGNSMDRSIVVGPGSHTVVVQWRVVGSGTTFRLDDWSLTVERSIK
jgi:hypothetical protein